MSKESFTDKSAETKNIEVDVSDEEVKPKKSRIWPDPIVEVQF